MSRKAIYWFQSDLRIHDQPVLSNLNQSFDELLCLYIIPNRWLNNPFGLDFNRFGKYRRKFLKETLVDLDRSLKKIDQKLIVLIGNPAEIISDIFQEHNIDKVFTQDQFASEERDDINYLRALIGDENIVSHQSMLMVDPESLPFKIDSLPFGFTSFRKKIEDKFSVQNSYDDVKDLPATLISFKDVKWPEILVLEEEETIIPEKTAFPFEGGESAALNRMNQYIWESQHILSYKSTRNRLVGTEYSSKFSPWLANGSLSARRVYQEVKKFEDQIRSNISTYWLIFELLWRDFFHFQALKFGAEFFKAEGIKHRKKDWNYDVDLFNRWRTGNTGVDFIDANMIELKETGFMSNRGRQNVASWLAHDYKIDWRWGAYWFEHCLIDYDPCSNYGNWMYVSGVGNDSVTDRRFNPDLQSEKYDKKNQFIKLWLN
ncbi:DASH family cryptochrome [Mangrovivirga sp. M17]|uniref:Cryptochrome DASH n=1 Tax=Mangrovivirga halotolerans TaxID=2993936 RepID=A0ABT3RU16_9BACT|nr:DASH family cryptochrome [Mangrovivirga halotolerans]MCX2744742.1 DASH family cryptochrome [Mangrovivirga halotolerans]